MSKPKPKHDEQLDPLHERRDKLTRQIAQTQHAIAQSTSRPMRSTKQRHLAAFRAELKTIERQIAAAEPARDTQPNVAASALTAIAIQQRAAQAISELTQRGRRMIQQPAAVGTVVFLGLLVTVFAIASLLPPDAAEGGSDPGELQDKQRETHADPPLIRAGALTAARPNAPDQLHEQPRPPRPTVAAAVEAVIELARTQSRLEAMRMALEALPDDLNANEVAALLGDATGNERGELLDLIAANVQPDSLHTQTAPDILGDAQDHARRRAIKTLAPLLQPRVTVPQALIILKGLHGEPRLAALRDLAPKLRKPIAPADQLALLAGLDLEQRRQAIAWMNPQAE